MFKAVLCDDDEIITQGLEQFIPWSDLDICLCGTAYDGYQAKLLVDQYKPDILITDIRMPSMDGLQLTRYAKENNSNIKVIIISGYDDFKYAHEAIKVGAMDYILKPIDENNLISQLKLAVKECSINEEQTMMVEENQKYLQKRMIQCLIYEGVRVFSSRYNHDQASACSASSCGIIIASIDNYENLAFQLTEKERNAIDEIFFSCIHQFDEDITLFEQHPGTAGCYILGENNSHVKVIRDSGISAISHAFQTACDTYTISFACSNIYNGITNLPDAYHEAKAALQERFVYPAGSIIYYDRIVLKSDFNQPNSFDTILSKVDFVALIKECDKMGVDAKLEDLKNDLLDAGGESYLYMKIITGNIYAKLLKDLYQLGIGEEELGFKMAEEYQIIIGLQSMEAAIHQFRDSIFKIIDALNKSNSSRHIKIVSVAENFIEEHYMDHDLSMDDVANVVHMSPSYFSIIFKEKIGIAFTDYLINKRIEKAKELMRYTDLRVYEISYKVGYYTAAYFSTAFKKVTGYPPTEYKRLIDQGEL
jgi:two-component system response regulator YesN